MQKFRCPISETDPLCCVYACRTSSAFLTLLVPLAAISIQDCALSYWNQYHGAQSCFDIDASISPQFTVRVVLFLVIFGT